MPDKTKYVTPAERYLVKTVKSCLPEKKNDVPRLLNIGAGKSVVIEKQIIEDGFSFICDRVDLEKYQMDYPFIDNVFQSSVEKMDLVKTEGYDIVFANYVLEHVQDINKAASEIYRILKYGGIFVTSLPNPTALEFSLLKQTPLWFHEMVRGKEAWKTYYDYKNIEMLCDKFQGKGFDTVEVLYWSSLKSYLKRFLLLNQIASLYDRLFNALQYERFMNNVCVVFKKPFHPRVNEEAFIS